MANESATRVSIRGIPDKITAAIKVVRNYINEYDELDIPRQVVQHVIGPKAETISKIQQEHSVNINIRKELPNSTKRQNKSGIDTTTVNCKVFGPAAGRVGAITTMKEIIEEYQEIQTEIPFPHHMKSFVLQSTVLDFLSLSRIC